MQDKKRRACITCIKRADLAGSPWNRANEACKFKRGIIKSRIARGTRGVRIGNSTGVHGVHGRREK